jgi:hypothetical protein
MGDEGFLYLRVAGDDHHSAAVGVLVEILHDSVGVFGIEVSGWFVGQEEFRAFDEGSRDCGALAFACAQLGGTVVEAVMEFKVFEELGTF